MKILVLDKITTFWPIALKTGQCFTLKLLWAKLSIHFPFDETRIIYPYYTSMMISSGFILCLTLYNVRMYLYTTINIFPVNGIVIRLSRCREVDLRPEQIITIIICIF